ncbi:hypothetical protein [Parachlamydia sp. AcF125]|nr:hypothetical protein [Parachlamydia sp. AcF125]MBS4168850.1 hypothetical protein [Parachlamydia sp. AcF125]
MAEIPEREIQTKARDYLGMAAAISQASEIIEKKGSTLSHKFSEKS